MSPQFFEAVPTCCQFVAQFMQSVQDQREACLGLPAKVSGFAGPAGTICFKRKPLRGGFSEKQLSSSELGPKWQRLSLMLPLLKHIADLLATECAGPSLGLFVEFFCGGHFTYFGDASRPGST